MGEDSLGPMGTPDPGDPEVERRLGAYADARLAPGAAATTRMRAAVTTAAHGRAALMEADAATAPIEADAVTALPAERPVPTHSNWRRPIGAVMAGFLVVGVLAGSVYSTKAGGPFYDARIWAEAASLPTALAARAQAEVARLDQRIQETQSASAEGDGSAARAALIAYSTIVIEAGEGSAGDPTATSTITITVTRHLLVLRDLAGVVPAPARPAAQQAIVSSTKVLDDLGGTSQQQGVH